MVRTLQVIFITGSFWLSGYESKNENADIESPETKNMDTKWKCKLCDEWHSDLLFAYGPNYPDPYFAIAEEERESRSKGDKDSCIRKRTHKIKVEQGVVDQYRPNQSIKQRTQVIAHVIEGVLSLIGSFLKRGFELCFSGLQFVFDLLFP